MEVDSNISHIYGNPQGILDQQLRPRPIHFLYILIWINNIKLYLSLCNKTQAHTILRQKWTSLGKIFSVQWDSNFCQSRSVKVSFRSLPGGHGYNKVFRDKGKNFVRKKIYISIKIGTCFVSSKDANLFNFVDKEELKSNVILFASVGQVSKL